MSLEWTGRGPGVVMHVRCPDRLPQDLYRQVLEQVGELSPVVQALPPGGAGRPAWGTALSRREPRPPRGESPAADGLPVRRRRACRDRPDQKPTGSRIPEGPGLRTGWPPEVETPIVQPVEAAGVWTACAREGVVTWRSSSL